MTHHQAAFLCATFLFAILAASLITYRQYQKRRSSGLFLYSRRTRRIAYVMAILVVSVGYVPAAFGIFDLQGHGELTASKSIEVVMLCGIAATFGATAIIPAHLDYVQIVDGKLVYNPIFGLRRQVNIDAIYKIGFAKMSRSTGFELFTSKSTLYVSGGIDHEIWKHILSMNPRIELTKMARSALSLPK